MNASPSKCTETMRDGDNGVMGGIRKGTERGNAEETREETPWDKAEDEGV